MRRQRHFVCYAVGAQQGQPRGLSFNGDHGKTFEERRKKKQVHSRHQFVHVGAKARKNDLILNSQLKGLGLDARAQLSVADEQQMSRKAAFQQFCKDFKQKFVIFLQGKAADVAYNRAVFKLHPAAKAIASFLPEREVSGVYGIVDHRDFA